MSTPLSQFDKPKAEQYQSKRKLLLVPSFVFPPDFDEDGQKLLDRYWNEVRDQIYNLERSLGKVARVYHETVFSEGEEGLNMVESLNPKAHPFIETMCKSTARMEALEDVNLVEEISDWQRCISVGLMSQKVQSIAMENYQDALKKRLEYIQGRLDETLQENEVGALFVREDHRIQFPPDIQVFYVAPPALNALKQWMDNYFRSAMQQRQAEPEQPTADAEASEETEGQQ